MSVITVEMHTSEIVGTCDETGSCSDRDELLADLTERLGEESEEPTYVIDAFCEQRAELCKVAGRCTLYWGTREEQPPVRAVEI